MGFVSNIFGGGASKKPVQAQTTDPTNTGQINSALGNANYGLGNIQAFNSAIGAQGGLGNQSSVFGQEQGLANQYQNLANGNGPNPALAQLNQTTAQNIQNQGALMASQRGASANPALIARQAAMQGANTQQQAAGQAATLQAQQQIAAMQALQQQQGQMGSLATNQVAQQQQGLGMYNQAAQNEQANLLGAQANYNNQLVGMQGNINSNNAQIAGQQEQLLGGVANAGGAAATMLAKGGMVKQMAGGGPVSGFGQYMNFNTSAQSPVNMNPMTMERGQTIDTGQGFNQLAQTERQQANKNKTAGPSGSATINTGDPYEGGFDEPISVAKGGAIKKPVSGEMLAAKGKFVPGQAKVKGDSLKNDTVPAMLSPGEVVIPRHIMQSNDPSGNAAKFVAAVMAKNGRKMK